MFVLIEAWRSTACCGNTAVVVVVVTFDSSPKCNHESMITTRQPPEVMEWKDRAVRACCCLGTFSVVCCTVST